jgi:2-polyprenyl-3-methyl-5-hydroxy-6-metoxy-1,4-benzoquinol methylase
MPDQADGLLSSWLRKKRFEAVRPCLQGKILDVGCGVGALSELVSQDLYFGVDIDEESLKTARIKYPQYRFEKKYPENLQFDTAVLVAIIEHIKTKHSFLERLVSMLAPNGRIVMTTPHPSTEKVYSLGAKIGLFSSAANQEHDQLLDYNSIEKILSQTQTSLFISEYRRFLFGANQLFILMRK